MALQNVTIKRVCLHEVHKRGDGGAVVKPTYGSGLLALSSQAMDAFRSRVVAAFKSTAQCMEMSIREFGVGSVLAQGEQLFGKNDNEFVRHSRTFADGLAGAQTSRSMPGGLMVIFDGTLGNPATPFFGVMKAELHEGFLKTDDLQAEFVSDLFLSPKTKLYKIGLFVSENSNGTSTLPDGWTAIVYDSAMSEANRDNAATYFYSAFLGLDIPSNAAQQVKKFFEHTRVFIKNSTLSDEHKVDLYNGLYSYLKLDQGSTIQTSRFAETYMNQDVADDYLHHMKREKFPTSAVSKDISEVKGSLKLRRLKFPRQITLSGPPDAVRDLVAVETVETDTGEVWTNVTIRGQLEAQE